MSSLGIAESNSVQRASGLVLDQLDALIYVCDLESYQILYMNESAIRLYKNGIGQLCFKWFRHGEKGICKSCPVDLLKRRAEEHYIHVRDYFNPLNNKWYELHDSLITWADGRKVKIQLAFNIDHRKNVEDKLMALYRQHELFSKIAVTFNQEESFAQKLNEVLQAVGKFIDVSRVSIFEIYPDKKYASLTYEWTGEGISPKLNKLRKLIFDSNLPTYKRISNYGLIIANDLNHPDYRDLFAAFRKFQARSLLFLPVFLHENHIGYISFEVCNQIREWQEDEIQFIRTFGNIISTSFERKYIQEKRIRSESSLRKANATKDKFLSIITRDLLAPFTALTSLSTMLLENYQKWKEEKRLLFVQSIKESSKQGYKLLDNLITWSKIQSGQIEFFPKDVDLRSAICLAAEQLAEKAHKKNLRIEGIPEDFTFVYADYMMLHTIVKNLLSNSIKFTPENGLISISLKQDDDYAEVCVCDNGIGIEKEYLNGLFKIDMLSADFGPTEQKGTGLGLIICKEFVEKNGGRIWAESKLGQGSCFRFTVPLSK